MAASGPEDDDPFREAKAYNLSIYLMVGMPYLLLGTGCFLIYRYWKKGQLALEAAARKEANEPQPTVTS